MQLSGRIEAVIIDLDGTLIDTAPDIAEAANRMLRELGRPARSADEVASFIGQGIAKLVSRCIDGDSADQAKALASFQRHYAETSGKFSQLFAGVREGLDAMRAQNLRRSCITNKAEQYTLPLLEQLRLKADFELIVSGDTLARKKPDPMPLQFVCDRFGIAPAAALMIGDSRNDTQAARAAGCPVVCVPYGYREGLEVRDLDCDAIVSTLVEAAALIQEVNSGARAK
jgi:phosphoglycolate phosphatase